MSAPGSPRRDSPDNEDFEGAPQESGQLPEEAPPEVTGPGGRDEKRGDPKRSGEKTPDRKRPAEKRPDEDDSRRGEREEDR